MAVPADAIDRARSVDILATAERFVILKRASATERVGPCPSCGGHDRFGVNVRKQIFNCRGCGAKGDVIALVMLALDVGFAEAVEELAGQWSTPPLKPREPVKASEEETAKRNSRQALAIFDGARSIRGGTLAEQHLVCWRNIDIDQIPNLDEVLRFDPRCPFGSDRLPCLISLVRNILTDEPQAVQRVALGPDGQKIDRLSLGPTKGGAIKLWEDAEVTCGLVVGEGMETVAAAATRITRRGTLLRPAWSLIDRGNLAAFPVLTGIEALTILVDADEDGDGQRAADACEQRWLDAEREVTRLTPKKLGADFAEIVVAGAGS